MLAMSYINDSAGQNFIIQGVSKIKIPGLFFAKDWSIFLPEDIFCRAPSGLASGGYFTKLKVKVNVKEK